MMFNGDPVVIKNATNGILMHSVDESASTLIPKQIRSA